MLQLVYNRAVDDLDVEESELEGEEIAVQFPISFRAAQWRYNCMEMLPAEGVAQLAELRCMMAAACGGPRGDLRTAKALMGRLPAALRVATRCSTVLGDATFRLQQGEAQSIELLIMLLNAIETEPERRTQQPTLFGPRELERC